MIVEMKLAHWMSLWDFIHTLGTQGVIKNSAKKGARTTRVNTTLVSVTHSMPRTFMASDTSTAPYLMARTYTMDMSGNVF